MPPAPEEDLSSLCQKLDLLTLRLMDDLERLGSARDALNQLIEKGWLSLSQSRYSMGQKFVSSLQYKQDMVPSATVRDSRSSDGSAVFEVERDAMTPREVEEIGAAEPVLRHRKAHTETSRPTGPRPEGDPASGPRTRPPQDPKPEGDPASGPRTRPPQDPKPEGDPASGPRTRPPQDPLHWFGILVPQSLRQAQNSFCQGILLAAEVATLQSDIETIRGQYRTLLGQKHELQAR